MKTSKTTTAAIIGPNHYELRGHNTTIVYDTTSIGGVPLLSYQQGDVSQSFQDKEIRVLKTEIGQLVSVTLDTVEDLGTKVLTILIPDVNLLDSPRATVQTNAIVTIEHTTIGGPVNINGQVQEYRVVGLRGVAYVIYS